MVGRPKPTAEKKDGKFQKKQNEAGAAPLAAVNGHF